MVRLFAFCVLLFAGLLFTISFQFVPGRYQLGIGDVSPYSLKSPQKVTYTSQIRTREEKARAAAAVSEIHVFDAAVFEAQRQKLSELLRRIGDARRESGSVETRRELISQAIGPVLRPDLAGEIVALSDAEWQSVIVDAIRVYDILMRGRITEGQFEEVRLSMPLYVNTGLNERQAAAVIALVGAQIRPSFILDPDATTRARREVQELIQPVRVTVEKGETVARDGEVVRPLDLERLEAVGLRNPSADWRSITATAILVALVISALGLYIHHFRLSLCDQPSQLLLLGLIVLATVLAIKMIVPGRDMWAYVLPVAAPVMLVALLLGADLAIITNLVIATCFGLISSNSFEMSTIALAGGLAGAMLVWRFERLNTFFFAGLVIALANLATATAFALLTSDLELQSFLVLSAVAALNGLLSAALTLGTLSALGHLFGITTTLGLLELAHPTQPLFKRLLNEAPGTYHHSVVIANLAERAAEAVGADPLLCRVAAYYHDVGKIVRPYAFIENQIPGENLHDHLDPATSARMISAHVTDGLELAKKYRLPTRIQDVIVQHHGTSLIGGFYGKAVKLLGVENVVQNQFRYPGPKPQSRESAILMLADGVEAATRASRDHAADAIEQIVTKLFRDRLAEGQFDECGLTFRDVDQVRRVFLTILRGMFHPRITYPEMAMVAPGAAQSRPVSMPVLGEPVVAIEMGTTE